MRMTFEFLETTEAGAELRKYHPTSCPSRSWEQVVAMGAVQGATMAFNQLDRYCSGCGSSPPAKERRRHPQRHPRAVHPPDRGAEGLGGWKVTHDPGPRAAMAAGTRRLEHAGLRDRSADRWRVPLPVGSRAGQEGEPFGFHGTTPTSTPTPSRWVVTEQMTGWTTRRLTTNDLLAGRGGRRHPAHDPGGVPGHGHPRHDPGHGMVDG